MKPNKDPLNFAPFLREKKSDKNSFKRPIDSKGRPAQYLKGIMCFLDGKPKKKIEILNAIYGEEVVKSRGIGRGQLSQTFSALRRAGIISYNEKRRIWTTGSNYGAYIAYVVYYIANHHARKDVFWSLFDSWGSNTEFFLKYMMEE